jgi:hypothetical protein
MNVYSNAGYFNNIVNTAKTELNVDITPTQIVLFLVAILLVIAVGLFWWFKPRAEEVTVMGPIVLKGAGNGVASEQKVLFTQQQIESSLGNNFTFSMFVYMDDSNRERIPLGSPDGDFRFKNFVTILGVGTILLDPIHQRTRVSITPLSRNASQSNSIIDIDNFMVARWNQVTLTLEGRTVDVYVNGVLAKSTLLENVPLIKPVMVTMETSPDFSGQAGLIQAWPRRLTAKAVADNYKRNTDTRGKPLIPDVKPSLDSLWDTLKKGFCEAGLCDLSIKIGGLDYVDYQYA